MSKAKGTESQTDKSSEKVCFVIMPISDTEGYPPGHFKRVYDHLIRPACIEAGFKPVRADDVQTTNMIALDIVKHILHADMAICDLSAKNPNVLYELGIRQAFNKPVTLIKDSKTHRIFDISGFRDVEYDESLRIDTVESSLITISETIKNTFENDGKEINSLTGLLGIEPAKVEPLKITADTELIMNTIKNMEARLEFSLFDTLSQLERTTSRGLLATPTLKTLQSPRYYGGGHPLLDPNRDNYSKGDKVFYPDHRHGEIINIFTNSEESLFEVAFENGTVQTFRSTDKRLKKLP